MYIKTKQLYKFLHSIENLKRTVLPLHPIPDQIGNIMFGIHHQLKMNEIYYPDGQ